MKLKLDVKEFFLLIPILGISFLLYRVAEGFPEASRRYPQLLLILIVILTVMELVVKIIKKSLTAANNEPVSKMPPAVLFRALTVMLLCVIYVFLVDVLGFFSATAAFSVLLMYYLGIRKPMKIIAVAVGLNLGVFLLFVVFLRLTMPQGLLF